MTTPPDPAAESDDDPEPDPVDQEPGAGGEPMRNAPRWLWPLFAIAEAVRGVRGTVASPPTR